MHSLCKLYNSRTVISALSHLLTAAKLPHRLGIAVVRWLDYTIGVHALSVMNRTIIIMVHQWLPHSWPQKLAYMLYLPEIKEMQIQVRQ